MKKVTGPMKVFARAKINLFLEIIGKRPDGYHNLNSLMCCIDLCDILSLTFGMPVTTVHCRHPDVPQDPTNLAYAAATLFFKSLDKCEGVKISIEKRIPVAAGLGGGSSDAAAVLQGLNRYYNHPFSTEDLISMGRSIGADVPFFIFGRPAIATGIGEKLEAYPRLKKYTVLLIYPGFGLSTAEVYKNLNLALTKCKKKLRYSPLKTQDFDVRNHLCNDLETVVELRHPEIVTAKEALVAQGAIGALMSGSGPTVYGLFSDYEKACKANQIISKHDGWQLYLAEMITQDGECRRDDAGQ